MPGKKALIADVVDTAQKLKREVKKNFHLTFYRHQDAKKGSVYLQFISVREKKITVLMVWLLRPVVAYYKKLSLLMFFS
jgi:hypothetical protein